MANMSGVVQQLKKELERAKKEVEQYGAALVALGGSHSNGHREDRSWTNNPSSSICARATGS